MTIFKTNSLIFLKAYCVPVYVFTPTRKTKVEIHMCGMFLSMAVSFPLLQSTQLQTSTRHQAGEMPCVILTTYPGRSDNSQVVFESMISCWRIPYCITFLQQIYQKFESIDRSQQLNMYVHVIGF